ncbi:MAG: hypothetical protein EHM64_14265 [Ignavibacteriae bacterium]|nr:MAG: hypothetical protein EHM64_14265 [Ignavibacteriota bacterium]
MNQKIDAEKLPDGQQEREFSPDFVRLLIALTGATLLIVFVFQDKIILPTGTATGQVFLYPWITAAGQTIANGLAEFSGKTPSDSIIQVRLAVLLGVIFGFIIGPTLFLFGWYQRRKDRPFRGMDSTLKGSAVISVIGGLIIFSAAIPAIPNAINRSQVESWLRSSQAIQENKDQVISDITMIAYNAHQYGILPRSLNGGEGSFAGYAIPQALAATANGTYKAAVTADEITLTGNSAKYPDCNVTLRFNRNGPMNGGTWKYEGQFQ